MSVRILIADDEPLARQRLARILGEDPRAEVVGEAKHGLDAVRQIRRLDPDLVFLDIRMPKADGFEVIRRIGVERMPWVVFVTAYDEHAARAFEVSAVDYVVKPFEPERLLAAFGRALERLERESAADRGRRVSALLRGLERRLAGSEGGEAPGPDRLLVRRRGRVTLVEVDDVDWVEAEGNYVRLHVGSESHLMRETLTNLEDRLAPARFARIHRSALVNLDRVVELRHWSSGEYIVELRDGTELKLSRTYRDRILDLLEGAAGDDGPA